jgi:threonine/homoserine/homoserine lactone efflux protein
MASPGPAVVSLIARVMATGAGAGTAAFAAGLVLGDIFWFAAAVFGVAALAGAAHEVMVALKYLGALYLAWLGIRLWTAPAAAPDATASAARLGRSSWSALAGGFSLAFANTKTMMFYLALLPTLVDLATLRALTFVELTLWLAAIYSAVLAAYIASAARARRLLVSPATRRAINRGSGAVMLGAAAFVATRR